jgi:MFS family permease
MASPRVDSYRILKVSGFRQLIAGRFCLTFALQLQTVVVGWQIYELKKDPLYLGLIGLSEAIPALSLALFGGHVVDRGQPITIYRRMIALMLFCSGILLLAGSGLLAHQPDVRVATIFGVVVLSGVIRAFAWPAVFSMTPQVVPREWMTVAQTWLSATFQIAAVTGPAIGGLIYAWKGPVAAYSLICLMVATALFFALRLRLGRMDRATVGVGKEPLLKSLTVGVRFVFSNQVVLGALSLDMFAVLFGGATALLPIFAADILKSGPQSLGLLRAAPAVGALAMSFWMLHRPLGRGAGALLLWAVAGFGLCMIGFGFSRNLWLSAAILGLSGVLDAVSVVVRQTVLQLWTPDEMRGRVSAINMIFIGSSNEIGEFESGLTARWMGTVPSVIFGGCMTLVVVGAAALLAPQLRKLEFDRSPRKSK